LNDPLDVTDHEDHEKNMPGRTRIQRISVGLPGFRATADRGTTFGRAARISVLGLTLDLLNRPEPREKDIERALTALSEASALVADLEVDLKKRAQDLTSLKEQYQHYEQLTRVEHEEARALLGEIEVTVGRGLPKERWIAAGINLVVGVALFGLGILVQRYWLS
jgi:hypothetical protein